MKKTSGWRRAEVAGEEKKPTRELEAGPPAAALAEMLREPPFGPGLFLGQLVAFVRDRCPDPSEGLPVVEVHLADGEVLDLCHIIGATPHWVALAVNEVERATSAPTVFETDPALRCSARHAEMLVAEGRAEPNEAFWDPLRAIQGPGLRLPGHTPEGAPGSRGLTPVAERRPRMGSQRRAGGGDDR